MTTALTQIEEEIAALEERLKLLRTAQDALLVLAATKPTEFFVKRGAQNTGDPIPLPSEQPARGLAAAIRGLLAEAKHNIPPGLTKASIEKYLSEDKWSLGKGAVSGALQAMRVRGVVARTKAGKWTMK